MNEPRMSLEQSLSEALRPAQAPAGLRRRLLAEARHQDRTRRRFWMLGMAALLVGGLVGAWSLLQKPLDAGQELAQTAAAGHAADLPLEFRGLPDESTPCGSCCEKRLGFAATLPQSVSRESVVGGRICQIRTHPAAYYRLACGDGLFVFERPPQELQHPRGFQFRKGATALTWTEGGRSYLRIAAVR